jgi:hypothetical protein
VRRRSRARSVGRRSASADYLRAWCSPRCRDRKRRRGRRGGGGPAFTSGQIQDVAPPVGDASWAPTRSCRLLPFGTLRGWPERPADGTWDGPSEEVRARTPRSRGSQCLAARPPRLPRVWRRGVGPVRERQEVSGIVGVPQEPRRAEPLGRLGAVGDEPLPASYELVLAAGPHVPVPDCVLIAVVTIPSPIPPKPVGSRTRLGRL